MGENRTHDTVSTVSRVSDHEDRAGPNHSPPGLELARADSLAGSRRLATWAW